MVRKKNLLSFQKNQSLYLMDDVFLRIVNIFFFVFHSALIIFNLFGWLFARIRKINLITLLLTFGSWVLLGIWKGWGYCFLTDWHYEVLKRLGQSNLPSSYIAFLVERITGWLPSVGLTNTMTLALAILALVCSLWVNFISKKKSNQY
ncbi:DUF2784 domain-containing protein [Arenibacter echinorum]|uniref:Uncharacterized protein DUF2784 n=1 Tax=Arenibacter echinorum TaxID=440515 RepID=A0A327R9Q1_9FLAO|nr:DUF2784 domain-containing protein [Arenibacter echinorum]RAJ12835.1 uncharacterized protein DUF2784 [Arenibacter echinorum]